MHGTQIATLFGQKRQPAPSLALEHLVGQTSHCLLQQLLALAPQLVLYTDAAREVLQVGIGRVAPLRRLDTGQPLNRLRFWRGLQSFLQYLDHPDALAFSK